VISLAALFQK